MASHLTGKAEAGKRERDEPAAADSAQRLRSDAAPSEQLTLYTSHRSNFAARARYVVYSKGLEDVVKLVGPPAGEGAVGGGATSLPADSVGDDDGYMQRVRTHNRIGKIPLLVLADGSSLPESQIIVEYLDERFAGRGPSLLPTDPADRARARLVARIHDVYMGSHFLPVLFRELSEEQTAVGLKWIETALDTLEGLHPGGEAFFVGGQPSVADIGLAPTIVYMLERGGKLAGGSPFGGRPKLAGWWQRMLKDAAWQKVHAEMETMSERNTDAHMFSGRV